MPFAPRVIALAGLLGCGFAASVTPAQTDDGALAATVVPAGAFPKTLVDPIGARVVLPDTPRRIASIALATDEMLLALVEPSRVAAVTFLVDDATTTELGGTVPAAIARVTEEPEHLLTLEPDLVLTAGFSRSESVRLLEAAGVPVVRIGRHESLADVLDAIAMLGRAVGEEARAATLVAALQTRIDRVVARAARRAGRAPRVLLWEGGCSYGQGTLQDELVRRAGGVNVVAEAGLRGPVTLTEEALLTLAPDVIVTTVDGAETRRNDAQLLGSSPVLAEVPAVRAGRVHALPRRLLGSVSQHAVAALEQLADVIAEAP
jgi:iron complex transport system substrate-binding protein